MYSEADRNRFEGRREIDARRAHGVDVVIWWVKKTDLLILSLTDLDKNQAVEFAINPEDVSEALQHPYYFADRAGVVFENGSHEVI